MARKPSEDSGNDTNEYLSYQIIQKDVDYLRDRIEREIPINLTATLSNHDKSILVLENNMNRDLPRINELTNEIGIIKQKQSDWDRNMKYYLLFVALIASLLTIIVRNIIVGGK